MVPQNDGPALGTECRIEGSSAEVITPFNRFPWQHHSTSTPTARGQFARFERVGNASNLEGSFTSITGDTFTYLPGLNRQRLLFESTSEEDESDDCDLSLFNEIHQQPKHWKEMPLQIWKFIDDFLAGERIPVEKGQRLFTQKKEERLLHAVEGQVFFDTVSDNAKEIGMRVNDQKTQILCTNSVINADVNAYITLPDGSWKFGTDELKILGFFFNNNPTVDAHVKELLRKGRQRSWVVRHLKRAGLSPPDLIRCYNSFVRPVLEYACVVFHPMLNQKQTEQIERIQRNIFKTIFRFEKSYATILEEEMIQTQAERRQELFDKFALKSLQSERYSQEWFPTKTFQHADLRRERIFIEKYARTTGSTGRRSTQCEED